MLINCTRTYRKIIECLELEENHKYQWDQILAPQRTVWISNFVSESVVQRFFELRQLGAATTALGNLLLCLTNFLANNLLIVSKMRYDQIPCRAFILIEKRLKYIMINSSLSRPRPVVWSLARFCMMFYRKITLFPPVLSNPK